MKLQLILPLFFMLLGCTKVITPQLDTSTPLFVIQGSVSDTAGPYRVSITKSVGFYNSNAFPAVSGATVTIADATAGISDMLTELAPGIYATHSIQGIPGHTYTLKVLLNGVTYTSASTMPMPVPLDSVSFYTNDTTQVRAQANFKDPSGITNYYKYSLTINGKYDPRIQTFDDRLSDGRYIRDKLDSDTSEIKRNDLVALSLTGIDKAVFTYFSEATDIAYSNSNLAAPATPQTNITGGCLGYFSAQTVSIKKAVLRF